MTTHEVSASTGVLDIDLDGLHDDWEKQIVDANPGDTILYVEDVVPGDDFDGDGLTNKEEFENFTVPVDIDSDDDGWSDLHEMQAGTSPTIASEVPDLDQFTVGGPGASDLNVGNAVHPLATLHHAVARINALDDETYTLSLTAGTYSVGDGEVDQPLTIEQDLSIIGVGDALTILEGNGAASWNTGITIATGASNVNLQGLTIQGFDKGIGFDTDASCLHLQNVTVQTCRTGLAICDSNMLVIDLGNAILTANETGILLAGSSNVIRNGSVTANSGDGIQIDKCGAIPYDNLIENTGVISNGRNGIRVGDGSGNRVVAATITGNNTSQQAYGGVAVFGGCTSVNQSVISGNQCYGVYADDGFSQSPVDARNNDWGDSSGPSGAGYGLGNSISENVLFIPWIGYAQLVSGTYYVDNASGSDDLSHGGAAGTAAWKTLHFAIDMINSGLPGNYTIHLAPGIYGVSEGEPDNPVALSENVSILGAGVGSTIIDGTGAAAWKAGFMLTPGSHRVTISDLTLNGFEQGILVRSAGGCLNLKNAAVMACAAGVVLQDTYQTTVDLTGSVISSNTVGIMVTDSSNNVIQGGVISGNTGDGILIDGCSESSDDNEINGVAISSNYGNGILVLDGSGNRVMAAIVMGNNTSQQAYGGVAVYGGCTSINESVISGNGCYGVAADDSLSQSPVDARDNYWGHPSGPSGAGYGAGDGISDYVVFTPWVGQTQVAPGTYFVDNVSGSDDLSNGGAIGVGAWKTIHFALDIINNGLPGDYTIQLAAGTYVVSPMGESDEPLMLSDNISIIGDGAKITIIDGAGAANWLTGLHYTAGASNFSLRNLSLRNFKKGIVFSTQGGCIDLIGVDISDCSTGLALVENVQSTFDLTGSIIFGNGTGILLGAGSVNNILRDGIVSGSSVDGIRLENGLGQADDNLFEEMRVIDSAQHGVSLIEGCATIRRSTIAGNQCAGVFASEASVVSIDTNLIYANAKGIWLTYTSEAFIQSNTITANTDGIHIEDGAKPDIRYNISWGNAPATGHDLIIGGDAVWSNIGALEYNDIGSTNLLGLPPNNISLDPQFTDPLGHDFSLMETSPGVDATDLIDPGVDFNGSKRPWGETWDLGALETAAMADTDGDGLPDWWEQRIIDHDSDDDIRTLEDVSPEGDYDNDGITNLDEFLGGTDPTSAVSVALDPSIANPMLVDDTVLIVTIFGTAFNAAAVTVHNTSLSATSGSNPVTVPVSNENWTTDIPVGAVQNIISITAQQQGIGMTVIADSQDPTVAILSPSGNGTHTTMSGGVVLSGQANDDTRLQSVDWTRTVLVNGVEDPNLAGSGVAKSEDEWATWKTGSIAIYPPVPDNKLDVKNVIMVAATDRFGNSGRATIMVIQDLAIVQQSNTDESDQGAPIIGDPMDPDGDGYHSDDEDACGSDPYNDPNSRLPVTPLNHWAKRYPTDVNDPLYAPERITADLNGDPIGYFYPDCLHPDDDTDGMPDDCELYFGASVTAETPDGDTDGDGLPNLQECLNGTNPTIDNAADDFSLTLLDDADAPVWDSWLPTYGVWVKLQAVWNSGGTPPAAVDFALQQTSRYPGRALTDPDPALTDPPAVYPPGYKYNGYDFGLSSTAPAPNEYIYDQSLSGVNGSGVYEVYLKCYDNGARTKVVVTVSGNPTIGAERWVPKGSHINGIGAAWDYDGDTGTPNPVAPSSMEPSADIDPIIFTPANAANASPKTAPLGDGLTNFQEYRGIAYTPVVDAQASVQFMRLNPLRKDLFVRVIGFADPCGDIYDDAALTDVAQRDLHLFRLGDAFRNCGIDVHNVTCWGHDATRGPSPADHFTFFTFVSAGNALIQVLTQGGDPTRVTGTNTSWNANWPVHEWEFKLKNDLQWIPIEGFKGSSELYLDWAHPAGGVGAYRIRKPLPHVNVMLVINNQLSPAGKAGQDGYIFFKSATFSGRPTDPGTRNWWWSEKGHCKTNGPFIQPTSYGLPKTYMKALEHYVWDRPYTKGTVWTGNGWRDPILNRGGDLHLAPLNRVEDRNDDGALGELYPDVDGSPLEDGLLGDGANGNWDGDFRKPFKTDWYEATSATPWAKQLSPFDIDHDGIIELPFASDPENIDPASEGFGNYTLAWILRHTITHEMVHALAGINHCSEVSCVMYDKSTDWMRDGHLCDYHRSLLRVHNIKR